MKYILLFFLIIFSAEIDAQIIDSTKCGQVVKIQPVKVKFTDSLESRYLRAIIINDNMIDEAAFFYELLDSNCHCTLRGNINISGSEYEQWSGSNEEAFLMLLNKISVTLRQD